MAFLAAFPLGRTAPTPAHSPGKAGRARPIGQVLLSPPHLTGGERRRWRRRSRSGWLAPAGPVPAAFEAAFSEATGFPHVLATASGTAALHLGYRCLGVAPGDEVWTSAPHLRRHRRARGADGRDAALPRCRPRKLDPRPRTCWNANSPAPAARGRLPRGVVPVDLFGQCCDLDAILRALRPLGRARCCATAPSALGARSRGGRHAGRGARLAAFSFNGNKIVTAGGGGALASDDPELLATRPHLATQAQASRRRTTSTRPPAISYGLSSVLAAIGLAQLPRWRPASRRGARSSPAMPRRSAACPGLSFMPEAGLGPRHPLAHGGAVRSRPSAPRTARRCAAPWPRRASRAGRSGSRCTCSRSSATPPMPAARWRPRCSSAASACPPAAA